MAVAKNVLKFIMAGLVAIVILHLIFCFYSLLPVHIANPDKNTDYVWEPNSCWIKMTEGISWGRFDAKGFNNMQVIPEPDIIVLGSSHMEATNIMQNSNISFLLNKKLNGKYSVYNMGISGHNFFKICQYISNNIELYNKPPKIIILETSTIEISEQNVKSVINSSVEYTPSYNKGIIGLLQKITVFRLLNQQIEHGLMNLFMPSKNNHIKNDRKNGYDVYEDKIDVSAYKKLFKYLNYVKNKYNTNIIIFYHPTGTLKSDGGIYFTHTKMLDVFKTEAKINDIIFVDMTNSFMKMFYESYHAAHGFTTGEIEVGHLNAHGHASVADSLYRTIIKLEEDDKLCQ